MIYRLEREQWIPAPRDEVFELFRDPRNLQTMTPPWLGFRFRREPPQHTELDMHFEYWIRLGGIPMPWRTRITRWEPPFAFVDFQESGPYRLWEHTHEFHEAGDGVLMRDVVRYQLPLGPLGRLAHALAVQGLLARIFDYRFDAIRERFPLSAELPGQAPDVRITAAAS